MPNNRQHRIPDLKEAGAYVLCAIMFHVELQEQADEAYFQKWQQDTLMSSVVNRHIEDLGHAS